ncbi:MAG: glycosyl transferase family 1 [Rhodothermales bacterium]|nr:glycosyl transferase family 1 [Rhodothermales bacterium]
MPRADRRVLIVAYYFPPMGLSGVQRIARFVKYLPEFGWQPEVLTIDPAGYFAYDASLLDELMQRGIPIHRTTSLDPTRLFGRSRQVALPAESSRRKLAALSHWLFVPDNKIGWMPAALRRGRAVLAERPFDAILATAPPYTAALIGQRLAAEAHLPLALDFRDDWVGNPRHVYPTALHRAAHLHLERRALTAAGAIFTINDRIRAAMLGRHAGVVTPEAFTVLPQGFDAADFHPPHGTEDGAARTDRRCRFVYSGVFYDRQKPDFFLQALARVLDRHPEWRDVVEAYFVGLLPAYVPALIASLGLGPIVTATGYKTHPEAIRHVVAADILWLTVGSGPGQAQISTSKLYEYLGTRKPILGLVPDGAARDVLSRDAAALTVDPENVPAIAEAIAMLVRGWMNGTLPQGDATTRAPYERRRLTEALAGHLDDLVTSLCLPE